MPRRARCERPPPYAPPRLFSRLPSPRSIPTRRYRSELKRQTLEKLGEASLSAGQGGLQSKAGTMLKALCDEFNDLNAIDKLANVQSKVDGVRTVMQSNIQSALKNTDKLEDIDEKAVVLAESANKFKNSSAGLKRNMRWRYIRMVSIMVLLAAAVLAVIIVPIVVSSRGDGGRRRRRAAASAPRRHRRRAPLLPSPRPPQISNQKK